MKIRSNIPSFCQQNTSQTLEKLLNGIKIELKHLRILISTIRPLQQMEHNSESKALRYRLAIAVVIIRNKPKNWTVKQYMQLLQSSFISSFQTNSEKITELKHLLFITRKKLFLEQNKDLFQNKANSTTATSTTTTTKSPNLEDLFQKFQELQAKESKVAQLENVTAQFNSNLDFLTNLIKLKTIDKNFRMNENSNELIMQCLSSFLDQLQHFFFKTSLLTDSENISPEASKTKTQSSQLSIPIDSLLHGLQVFLNVYDIEWLYYFRGTLIERIETFIKNLVKFIINFPNSQKQKSKLFCASQMLIVLSTSDYLLNPVLDKTIKSLQVSIDYICEKSLTVATAGTLPMEAISNIAQNCSHLSNSVEFIVKLRHLDNFREINSQVKRNLVHNLNTVFIRLTDVYPLLAIQMSKLMQLLNVNEK